MRLILTYAALLISLQAAQLSFADTGAVSPWRSPKDCSVVSTASVPVSDFHLAKMVETDWLYMGRSLPIMLGARDFIKFLEINEPDNSKRLMKINYQKHRKFIIGNAYEYEILAKYADDLHLKIGHIEPEFSSPNYSLSDIISFRPRVTDLYNLWLLTGNQEHLILAHTRLQEGRVRFRKLEDAIDRFGLSKFIEPDEFSRFRQSYYLDNVRILSALAMEHGDTSLLEAADAYQELAQNRFLNRYLSEGYEGESLVVLAQRKNGLELRDVTNLAFHRNLLTFRRATLFRDPKLAKKAATEFRNLAQALESTCQSVDRSLALFYAARGYESEFHWQVESDSSFASAIQAYEDALAHTNYAFTPFYYLRTLESNGRFFSVLADHLHKKGNAVWIVYALKSDELLKLAEQGLPRTSSQKEGSQHE